VGGLLPAKRDAQSVRNVRLNVGSGDAERITELREEESGVALFGGAGGLSALDEGVDGHRGRALHRTQGTSTKAAAITFSHRPRGSMRPSIQGTESSLHRRASSLMLHRCGSETALPGTDDALRQRCATGQDTASAGRAPHPVASDVIWSRSVQRPEPILAAGWALNQYCIEFTARSTASMRLGGRACALVWR